MSSVPPGSNGPHTIHPHIHHETLAFARRRSAQDRVSDRITGAAGSMPFVYAHVAWFTAWILLNSGLLGRSVKFDPYPFGLLTLVVSLEAIFLATFVMISQNREAARSEVRSELDFETNVRSEVWLRAIAKTVGVDPVVVERHVTAAVTSARAELMRPPAAQKRGGSV
jgi:uncharacterized membrane protein